MKINELTNDKARLKTFRERLKYLLDKKYIKVYELVAMMNISQNS